MENMDVIKSKFWHGKKVFLSGHTGFKGGWLTIWLAAMGAEVHGYAIDPPTEPNFYNVCNVGAHLKGETIADVRNAETLTQAIKTARPEVVFHLAAQPLVLHSYLEPVETYAVNVMGTVNLLEAARQISTIKAIVNVTTDKCYENKEWLWPYRECEALGGHDPYSSSKACSEIVSASYRRSFLASTNINLASARSGNVIGGGDWAENRLVPDFLRAIDKGQTLVIRYPEATRPWQHVLEPLSGYLLLAERLYDNGKSFADAWNFGPEQTDSYTVRWIAEYLCSQIHSSNCKGSENPQPHEANNLQLDISKARKQLGWHPRWDLETALGHTLSWHSAWKNNSNMSEISLEQIRKYQKDGKP